MYKLLRSVLVPSEAKKYIDQFDRGAITQKELRDKIGEIGKRRIADAEKKSNVYANFDKITEFDRYPDSALEASN